MRRAMLALLWAAALGVVACETAPKTQAERSALELQADATIAGFKAKDPGLEAFFETSAGYAVFPTVGKGAVGVGGAHGRGVLYEDGEPTGFCSLSQGSIGLALGGQAYSEVIFFQTRGAVLDFKAGRFALAAQASAVAAEAGASADADYDKGVAVFTMAKGGLMAEASVGGQQFDFEPR